MFPTLIKLSIPSKTSVRRLKKSSPVTDSSLSDRRHKFLRNMDVIYHPLGRINAGSVVSNPADRADRDNDGWFKISSLFTVMEYGVLKEERGESWRGPGDGKLSPSNPRGKVRFPLRMPSARERRVGRSKIQEETLTGQKFNRG